MRDDDLDDVPDFLDRKKSPLPPSNPKPPQPKEVPVRTQTTTTKTAKLPVPPPKTAKTAISPRVLRAEAELEVPTKGASVIEKPLSKKALRAVAEKAVKESNVTKFPMRGSKEAKAAARAKAAKPAKAEKAPKPKKARAPRVSNLYDWAKAQTAAEGGKVPALPPFTSYAPYFQEVHDFARKGETAEIVKYMKSFKDKQGGRKNLFRFADLCVTALNVRLTSR